MRVHGNYHIHCLLKEIMSERGMAVDELHRTARVGKTAISLLRQNRFEGVNKRTIAQICGTLKISLGDLFVVLPRDIWLPIHLAKEVTFHVGSQAETRLSDSDEAAINRQSVGLWDLRGFTCIWDHLSQNTSGIRVRFREHITGPGRARAAAQSIFESGNHIVLASPNANGFAEEVVSHAFGVPPCSPVQRDKFPYGFEWDGRRTVPSSFGWQGHGKKVGIAALPSNQIVAEHVLVPFGTGKDCALLVVYRIFQAPARREFDDDVERIIICLLGYSGTGTLAAAQLATDPQFAAELYPSARHVPRMRALACEFSRLRTEFGEDNREITAVNLVPEEKPPKSPPRAPGGGGRWSGRQPRPPRSIGGPSWAPAP